MAEQHRRCCFSPSFTERFLTLDAWNPFTGPRWNVNKLRNQMIGDVILCGLIFIITEGITIYQAKYWRPIEWGIYWIVVQVANMAVGVTGAAKRSPGFLLVFIVLTIMFSCINISHTNQMKGEIYRSCRLAQISYKDCDPAHNAMAAKHLSKCILDNSCTAEILEKTSCTAPGSVHCSDMHKTELMFFINALINFFTYAEPCFWAILLLIRAEVKGDTCPDDPQDGDAEFPYPEFPQIFGDESVPLMGETDKNTQ